MHLLKRFVGKIINIRLLLGIITLFYSFSVYVEVCSEVNPEEATNSCEYMPFVHVKLT
jgi:hypothetical protein